ncbi:b-box zinc finger protein [Anaeramoeba flamelloides]|uniref:B-box zinc finger protein n=1 Tax=Anaeramoeba flamelloides TaxID=1746091 RepID=A0AAV7YGG2_9EUKA|nr:b-box zinc finger protein [Anaeramoeba flamelloides]
MYKSRSSQKKKQKSQDPKRLRNIRIPVELEIPQCEVCEEKKADFYCTECKVHYCQNCESEVHTSFWKKKHKEFIFQEPYVPRKKINSNLCGKHKKELCLYYEYSNEISEKIKIILNKIQNEEIQSKETIQKSLELKNKFKIEIKELSNLIETQSDLLIQKIQKLKINHLNLLKKVGIISDLKFDQIINKNEAKKEEINETKKQIKILKKLEKDEKTIKLIRESKEIIEKDKQEGGEGEKEKKNHRKKENHRETMKKIKKNLILK